MGRNARAVVLEQVRRLAEPPDAELLHRFVTARDEAAFEGLVRRHGPLVYGLCRRLLHDAHAADDVFQASFLVLARKAGSVRKPAGLASWLYGVASRLAVNARRKIQRRRRHEVSAADLPPDSVSVSPHCPERHTMATNPQDVLSAAELRVALQEELGRLPDKYRSPLFLCGCAGQTTREAARALGCPEPTLKSRLRRGRELLRDRLARRGFVLSSAATMGLLPAAVARAAVPAALMAKTARAALLFLARQTLAGLGRTEAVRLAEGLLRGPVRRNLACGLLTLMSLTLFGSAAMLLGGYSDPHASMNSAPPLGDRRAVAVDPQGDPLPTGAVARLGTVRWRHGNTASFVAFMPDGKGLLSGGEDATARLWDVATGQELRRFKLTPHRGTGYVPLALSGDGCMLVSATGEEPVRVWNVATGQLARPLKQPPPAAALLALDHSGKRLAVCGLDGSLGLWDLTSGKRGRLLRAPSRAAEGYFLGGRGSLTFAPDGQHLAETHFEAPRDEPARSVLRVWETATGKERLRTLGPSESNGAFNPGFTPDSKILGWSGTDGVVRLVDATTSKEVRKLRAEPGPARFVFSADGKTLVTRCELSREVTIWDWATGKKVRTLGPPADAPDISAWGFGGAIQSIALSPDGKRLALAGEGCAVSLLDLQTGRAANVSGGHQAAVSALAYLTAKRIATGGNDGTIRLWETMTGKLTGRVKVPRGAMTHVLSRDGKTLATTGVDNVLRVWEAQSGKARYQLPGGANSLALFDFAPDGKTLAVTDPSTWSLRLYDVASGKQTLSLGLHGRGDAPQDGVLWAGAAPAFYSPDARLVAACVPSLAIVAWDASTGREVLRVPSACEGWPVVAAACFAPDGRTLALVRDDHTVALFELASGKERTRFGAAEVNRKRVAPGRSVSGQVNLIVPIAFGAGPACLTYSPDGRFLALSNGRAVRLWDVAARKELRRFQGHGGDIVALAYAPDGKTLVTGGTDGTGLVWDVSRLTSRPGQASARLKAAVLAAAWKALAGEDAARAFEGLTTLAAAPRQAVPFLRDRLKPASLPRDKDLRRWITELGSDRYAVRRQAEAALRKFGPAARLALQQALAGRPTLEVKRRLETILAHLSQARLTGDNLRVERAIEALELMGTVAAREVLTALADGMAGAPATESAKAALMRLKRAR
jgi:RNA polymerase sigma factor (sigma-70 family)